MVFLLVRCAVVVIAHMQQQRSTVPRTIGVSSTDLVGRMLLVTKNHFVKEETISADPQTANSVQLMSQGSNRSAPKTVVSNFLPSSRRIVQFSEGRRDPVASDVVRGIAKRS